MYSLCVLDERTYDHKTVKVMNEEEYQDIKSLIDYLDSVVSSNIKYEMIKRNDAALLQYPQTARSGKCQWQRNPPPDGMQ